MVEVPFTVVLAVAAGVIPLERLVGVEVSVEVDVEDGPEGVCVSTWTLFIRVDTCFCLVGS